MKKKMFIGFILLLIVAMTLTLFACKKPSGDEVDPTPVFNGITITKTNEKGEQPKLSSPSGGASESNYGAGNGKHNGDCTEKDLGINQETPFKNTIPTIKEAAESKLGITGAEENVFCAAKDEYVYVNIHLTNPRGYQIISVIFNGQTWAYQSFEPNSDAEHIVLKYNVGDIPGIKIYTLNVISYLEEQYVVKEILPEENNAVKVGIWGENPISLNVSNEVSTLTEIKFQSALADAGSLISQTGGYIKAVLYDGENLVEKDIDIGDTSITFDNLKPNKLYQYGIVAYFNDLSGSGPKVQVLYKKAVHTKANVLFDSNKINVTKTSASWDYLWRSGVSSSITSLSLWKGNTKVKDLTAGEKSASTLLCDNTYSIKAKYNLKGKEEEISFSFKTLAKATPVVNVVPNVFTKTSLGFDVAITDKDSVGTIDRIELYLGDEHKTTTFNKDARDFNGLDPNKEYTIKVSYKYDLNDGKGERVKVASSNAWTATDFSFISSLCTNTEPVNQGENIYFRATVNNPKNITINKVKIDGIYYDVASGTNQSNIFVTIPFDNQFEGGDTEIIVSEISGLLNGVERKITITDPANATGNVFINGALTVKSFSIVDKYGNNTERLLSEGVEYHYLIKLGNKTGYDINSITINGIDYSKNYWRFNQIDDENILIITTYNAGWRKEQLTKIEYSNESVGNKTLEVECDTDWYLCLKSFEPIVISTPEQLKDMKHCKYYVLESDLDLTDVVWENPQNFVGYFDGQGHIIKNMSFTGEIEDRDFYWGLFGQASGIIENLKISGRLEITITSTTENKYKVRAGAIASVPTEDHYSEKNKIQLNQVASNVTLSIDNQTGGIVNIGGFFGSLYYYYDHNPIEPRCEIKNSYSTGVLSTGNGLAHAVCENCYFTSTEAKETPGVTRKASIQEIRDILKPIWGDSVWDFDVLDDNGNPTTKDRYDITYHLDGGANDRENLSKYTKRSSDIALKDATCKGYIFQGWYDNASFTGAKITKIAANTSGNKEYWAKWHQKASRLSFEANGGNPVEGTIIIASGVNPPIATTTHESATFLGWYTASGERITRGDGSFINPWACDEQEVTLYARWLSEDTYTRIDENGNIVANGEYILFGKYPQTIKADSVNIPNPDTPESNGYYLGSDNFYYAKVTATPSGSGYKFSNDTEIVDGTDYYFKVEPIKWRILNYSTLATDAYAFLLCESIIDHKSYNLDPLSIVYDSIYEHTFKNVYTESAIRVWLNNEFYNTVFDELQKELIQRIEVENDSISAGLDPNQFIGFNTNDKIFLPSYSEVTNEEYGFSANDQAVDGARKRSAVDFAKAIGAGKDDINWWLRSPDNCNNGPYIRYVCGCPYGTGAGRCFSINTYNYQHIYHYMGIVPALVISIP